MGGATMSFKVNNGNENCPEERALQNDLVNLIKSMQNRCVEMWQKLVPFEWNDLDSDNVESTAFYLSPTLFFDRINY